MICFNLLRRLTFAGLAITALPLVAADVTSTWNASNGNWSVNANWTNAPVLGGFPNNGNLGVLTYDAILGNGGTITLDQNIVLEKFTIANGSVTGSFNLTLNDNLQWSGGTMGGTGSTEVIGTATIVNTGVNKGLDRTLNNSGTITYSAADLSNPLFFGLNNGAATSVLNNNGTFNTTAGGDFTLNAGVGRAINNAGTWNVSGAGTTSTVNGIAFNNTTGTVNVLSGATLSIASGYTQTAGVTRVSGGTITSPTINITSGSLEGTGTINGVVNNAGIISLESGGKIVGAVNVTGSGTMAAADATARITGNVSYLSSSNSTFGGIIAGVGKTVTLNNSAATLTLVGPSTYTGATTVTAGTLKAGVASVPGASGAFGRNSAVSIANSASATLDITDFDTQIGSLSGGGASGGNVTLGAATLTFAGTNTSPAVYSGSISGSGGINKIGPGTQTLSTVQTYTGRTTIGGGALRLDFASLATPTNILNSTSALTLGGGNLSVLGKTGAAIASAQTLGDLTLSANTFSTIALDPNNSGTGGTTLTLGDAWTRNPGSTLLIDLSSANTGTRRVRTPAAVTGTGAAGINGIFGYALVIDSGGTGFAKQDGSFNLVRNTTPGTVLTMSNSVAGTTATDFTTVRTDPGYAGGTLTLDNVAHAANTLSIDTTGGGTLNLGGASGVLALSSNALLVQGTGNYTIQNGALGASGSEVIAHHIGSGTLTISSPISGGAGGLTKDGTGTLTLTGPQNYATLTTGGGITNLRVALGTGNSTINANARVNITTSQTLEALNIGADGVVTLSASLPAAPAVGFDEGSIFADASGLEADTIVVATAEAVPEPGSASLFFLGALGLLGHRRRG